MSDPTPEEVRASIVPKSDQLNADDLLAGPITVTISGVRKGDREQPIVVEIEGQRPYKPCKSMRRILIATYGDNPRDWVGQRMTLFCDQSVMWAGVKVGGIRISHLSGLTEPRTYMLTTTRGKRSEFTIQPLTSAYVDDAIAEIAKAESLDALKQLGEMIAKRPAAERQALRDVYAKRKAELEA